MAIHRGERKIIAPTRSDFLLPYDRIVVLGVNAQLAEIEKFLQGERFDLGESTEVRYHLDQVTLSSSHPVLGKTLRESGIRERVHGIVLGIERGEERLLNPDSTTILQAQRNRLNALPQPKASDCRRRK